MKRKYDGLPAGTVVDQYRIEHILGGGGFGIVYLATACEGNQRVVVKEYMPGKLARRLRGSTITPRREKDAERFNRGRKLFIQEARTLATLKHPNIVNVTNFFQANGTVYMVMEFQRGENLQNYLRSRGGRRSERFLRTVFPPLLEALHFIHSRNILHLDIKPGNIHIRPGGKPLLLDFGAVHEFPLGRHQQICHIITPGYSPIEQYRHDGYIGPWTDIYAIGATMRSCIDGRSPVNAETRHEKDSMRPASEAFSKHYSPEILRAIDWAMEVDPLLRPQSVPEFLDVLVNNDKGATDEPSEPVQHRQPESNQRN